MADEAKGSPAGDPEQPKSSGRPLTWLWMALSLVVVVGFLVWLGMASEPTSVPVAEDVAAADTAGGGEGGVVVVEKDSLAANKAAFEGRRIEVSQVEATTQLGPRIFWGELGSRENQVPILVRLDTTAAEGWQMRQGALYTLTGQVQRMTDSVATAWGERGEFAGEGEQMQATFTDYFIQTSRIRPSRGAGARGGTEGGGGAAGNGG